MTGLKVIIAALVAGAASGTSTVAGAAIGDAYTGLRDVLRGRLHGRRVVQELDAEPTDDPGVWQARLGGDLTEAGLDRDPDVLDAARRVLAAADPVGAQAGKYTVRVDNSTGVQVGDHTIHVGTSTGGAVGTFHAPVTVNASPPVPPVPPAAQ